MSNTTIIEFREHENTTYYYEEGFLVASLDFNSDTFETDESADITKEEGERYYAEMVKDREEYLNQ